MVLEATAPLSLVVQEGLRSRLKPKIIQHICIISRCGGSPPALSLLTLGMASWNG